MQRRIDVYYKQTSPLIDYYRQEGKLVEVDGELPIDEVTCAILEAVDSVRSEQ